MPLIKFGSIAEGDVISLSMTNEEILKKLGTLVELETEEVIQFIQEKVDLFFSVEQSKGKGNLILTTRNVIWLNEKPELGGYSIDFRFLIMHAIARENSFESFPQACLYCHMDREEDNEVRFVPEDKTKLDAMYNAFSDCALLNPDIDDEMNDDEGEFFYNEEEVMNGINNSSTEERASKSAKLAHWETVFKEPTVEQLAAMGAAPGQFEDPAEKDDEKEDMKQ